MASPSQYFVNVKGSPQAQKAVKGKKGGTKVQITTDSQKKSESDSFGDNDANSEVPVPPADENFPKITKKGTANPNLTIKSKKSKKAEKQTTRPSELAIPSKTPLEPSQDGSAMSLAKSKCLQCNDKVHAKECGKLLGCGHYFHP